MMTERVTGLQNRGSQVRVLSPLWLYQAKCLVNRVIAGLREYTAEPRQTPPSRIRSTAKATANTPACSPSDAHDALHHELRREAVPPSVAPPGTREHPHGARQDGRRPTRIRPAFGRRAS